VDGAGARDGLEGADLNTGMRLAWLGVDCTGRTRFSLMAGLSAPTISFWAAAVRSGRPPMERYSWLRVGSLWMASSA
jgi:hypothetical protein